MAIIQVPFTPPASGTQNVEFAQPTSGGYRQIITVGDPSTEAAVAKVNNADPGGSDYGLTVRTVNTTTNPNAVQGTGADAATASGNPVGVGGIYNSSAPTYTNGQRANLQVDANGNLKTNIQNSTFAVVGNVASGATDSGSPVKIGGKYNSTPITLTNGQRGDIQVDANGYLKVNVAGGGLSIQETYHATPPTLSDGGTNGLEADAAGNLKVTLGTRLDATNDAVQALGNVAAGASDSGAPVKIGGVAKTANPTAVTDGQRANFITDKLGKQVVVGAIRDLKGQQSTTITSSTSEATIVTAGGAGVFNDLYGLILTNTSGSTQKATLKDSTSGTTRAVFEIPAGDTRGFMLPVDSAIPQSGANANWTITCGTSLASLEVSALFVKNL